jgi:hypothetical protein
MRIKAVAIDLLQVVWCSGSEADDLTPASENFNLKCLSKDARLSVQLRGMHSSLVSWCLTMVH